MQPERLRAIQHALAEEGFDAWLFCDFRGSDPIGRAILGLGDGLATRRWFYAVPVEGIPRALVSAVEPHVLVGLPGETSVYRTWQDLHAGVRTLLGGARQVAMQYSPRNDVPYVARVDAGTVELVRQCGVDVGSSADLVQRFEAVWTPAQYASHCRAAAGVRATVAAAFAEIAACQQRGRRCDEGSIQAFILAQFAARGLTTHHPPIVAVGPHSADPHYQPPATGGQAIGRDDFVLIDLWAKEPDGVYADITWTGFVGATVPERYTRVFDLVRQARDAGVAAVRRAVRAAEPVRGCDVDAQVRAVIDAAGFGDRFVHRTGHSIGTEVHGNGANIDGFETPDSRRLLPGTCFSIEPGVYLPGEFGVRSELNVYVDVSDIVVTGEPVQRAVVAILGDVQATEG
ncbi:MAG: M24 family metallopeptidase [Candidatus Binatia bacterium]